MARTGQRARRSTSAATTSHQHAVEPPASVRAHHDEVATVIFRHAEDFLGGVPLPELVLEADRRVRRPEPDELLMEGILVVIGPHRSGQPTIAVSPGRTFGVEDV